MSPHRLIPLADRAAWDTALSGVPHGFAHTWQSCSAMKLTTRYDTYLYCFERGDTRIVCPIAERDFRGHIDIVTPYGYSGFIGNRDCDDFPQRWQEFAREREYVCGYIGLNPALHNETFVDPATVVSHNDVYLLDLTRSHDELWHAMSEKRRKELRDYDTERARVVTDRAPLEKFFFDHYEEFFARKSASQAYSGFSRETLAQLLRADNTIFIGAGESRLEAVFLFTFTEFAAEGLFNISTEVGREYTALLTWYGVEQLRTRRVPVLNLGGGVRPDDGMAEFKRRFGAMKVPLQSARQVYRAGVYETLCRESGTSSDPASGYFPPYRAASARKSATQD